MRDLIYRRLGRHADRIVVDSEHSKADLVRFFGLDPARIWPVPMSPPPHAHDGEHVAEAVSELKAKRLLPERFLFYPAQLWDHKNHRRLFEAVARLRREGLIVPLVLTGGLRGATGEAILATVPALGLADQVFYLGYVSEREIVALYKLAVALVFPSFADYTNIPILEAMALGTPVICSNLFAMPEHLDGAGVLFDPFDVDDIASAIRRVWENASLRREMAVKGRRRVAHFSLDAFAARWREVLIETAGKAAVRQVG